MSLFSHDPEFDFRSLTREAFGRRVQTSDPDRSLMLLKATGAVPHGGGKRLDKSSWQYQVLRAWIAAGSPRSLKGAEVVRIAIEPSEVVLAADSRSLKVTVDFADGRREDVTPYCRFRVQDETVADVSALGEVRGLSPGETAIVASYKGHWAHASAIVPVPAKSGSDYPVVAENNFIDREVFAKLRRLNVVPSDLSSDEEFLRRLTIDTIGRLPTPAEVREFLTHKRAGKRSAMIDRMLAHLDHASLWATRFCDITACNQDTMEGPPEMTAKRAKMWHDWFRRRVADNMSYDRIVHGVLCATSRDGQEITEWIGGEASIARQAAKGFETSYADRESLDLFWRRFAGDEFFPVEQMAELTATAFLGIRIECAQCHKHPFDRWTQSDYRAFGNIFASIRFGHSIEAGEAIADIIEQRRKSGNAHGPALPRVQEIYVDSRRPRALPRPDSAEVLRPTALGGPSFDDATDCREQLFRWLVGPDNPYFARSFVNRVWAHYTGRGLVEPVDQFSADNPASNERLLAALARDFVDHRYDLRRLERTILNSRTYQLSSRPNDSNRTDRTHGSHARVRPMMAEAVVDALDGALGPVSEARFAPDSRAIEIAGNRVKEPHLARIFKVFGRPARSTQCDCEQATRTLRRSGQRCSS